MGKKALRGLILTLFWVVLILVWHQIQPQGQFSRSSSQPLVEGVATPSVSLGSGVCVSKNGLPDSKCTPGVIDPRVTQDNIQSTICVSGYTKGVRPPASYTDTLKIEQIKEYGYTDTNPRDYEEDHLISLELGGNPTDPKNLWPELGASPNSKDKVEGRCHEMVCSGQISLSEAQKEISTNWQSACGL